MATPQVNAPLRSVEELRARYRHLVWSNPEGASDDAYLFAALRRASFFELLDFATVFGLNRLQSGWKILQDAEPGISRAAQAGVDRILRNLQQAAQRCAQARNSEFVGAVAP